MSETPQVTPTDWVKSELMETKCTGLDRCLELQALPIGLNRN